ncbi:MAG: hypothetical protein WAM28_06065 [Chlamydiales bacterium]
MFLQKKALYNLIHLNLNRVHESELEFHSLEPWQIENYRQFPTEDLFLRLNRLGITLNQIEFENYGKNYEIPEEMAETLAQDREPLELDQIFLIVFELWRRLFPEKRSLSIFCDELDHQIMLYDLEEKLSSTPLQDALAYLQQILDEQVDENIPPKEAFMEIQTYCATDLESFLFDYILTEIEMKNLTYASELLEGFYQYFIQPEWFNYLIARVEIEKSPEEGYEQLEKMISTLGKDINLTLLEEILYFLANSGNHTLFHALATKIMPLLTEEGDFREFIENCYAHYEYLELQQPAEAIAQIFFQRTHLPAEVPLNPQDPDLLALHTILNQKLSFSIEN